ncbi:MAG: nuclear transport factor 2 family protein [Candidatus Eisenbacteria bacterium]
MAIHAHPPTAADRAALLGHIESIFRAYIARDRAAIRGTHTPGWTGFQGPSVAIERGIDAYMKNADASLEHLRGTGFEILDSEIEVRGDVALVYYVARYEYLDADGQAQAVPLRSLDVYERESGGWIQCGSHIAVVPGSPSWIAAE